MADNPNYRSKQGHKITRVTSVIGQLDKSGPLVGAAIRDTKEGIDVRALWRTKRDAGTFCHLLISAYLEGDLVLPGDVDGGKASNESKELGTQAFWNWQRWWLAFNDQHTVVPLAIEEPLVSEWMQVGGTPDLIAEVDRVVTVIDWKTASKPRVYKEAQVQCAAYMDMWNEVRAIDSAPCEQAMVVSIPTLPFAEVVTSPMWSNEDLQPASHAFANLILVHGHMQGVDALMKEGNL